LRITAATPDVTGNSMMTRPAPLPFCAYPTAADVVARRQAARHDGRVGRAPRTVDSALESAIRDLLAARAATATICPSEAARRVATEQGSGADADWRSLMEPARTAARRLVDRGEVEIVQRGRVVDPATARGPIRIRRAR
jgi:uncharacterized protein DUF3253